LLHFVEIHLIPLARQIKDALRRKHKKSSTTRVSRV
jgi:hypothetical protein